MKISSSPTKPVFLTPHFYLCTGVHENLPLLLKYNNPLWWPSNSTSPSLVMERKGQLLFYHLYNSCQEPRLLPKILSTLNWCPGPASPATHTHTYFRPLAFDSLCSVPHPRLYSPPYYLRLHYVFCTPNKGIWLLLPVPSCPDLLSSILLGLPNPDPSHWQSKLTSHPVSLLEFKVFSHLLIFNWLPDHTIAYPDHTNPEHLLVRPDLWGDFAGPVLSGGHLSPGMIRPLEGAISTHHFVVLWPLL